MKRMALVAALAMVGGVGSASARHVAAPRHVDVNTSLITPFECQAFAVNGKVDICHATGSPDNAYVALRVPVSACQAGHGGHERDFVSPDGVCH